MEGIKKQSLKNNFIFQFVYQTLILAIPLVVSPYLTRIIGDSGLGTYSYVNSIAYYFVVFANLGIAKHGQRVIAQSSNDPSSLRKSFWSLYTVHFFFSFLSIVIYFFIFGFFVDKDKNIYLVQGLYVASALFDITWLFYGLENFKTVVIKNAILKVIECTLIFLFIKKQSDLLLYTLISCGFLFLGHFIMVPQAFFQIKPVKFGWNDCKKHIKPLFIFSISVIAVSLYTIFDKTLLGLMTTKENVAYYEYANKIISLPRAFVTIIGTVMFPRACKMAKEGNYEAQKNYLKISIIVVAFLGMSSLFGLLAISKQFSIFYYGDSFSTSGDVMMAMCAIPLIIGLGDIVRSQYLVPNHMDKEYTICIILNALINLILSISLIPFFGIYGAVIGTCTAELFGCIFQLVICRRFLSPFAILKTIIPFGVIGAIMFGSIKIVSLFLNQGLLALLIQIFVGMFVYCILSLAYLIIFEKNTILMLFGRFFKKNTQQ